MLNSVWKRRVKDEGFGGGGGGRGEGGGGRGSRMAEKASSTILHSN